MLYGPKLMNKIWNIYMGRAKNIWNYGPKPKVSCQEKCVYGKKKKTGITKTNKLPSSRVRFCSRLFHPSSWAQVSPLFFFFLKFSWISLWGVYDFELQFWIRSWAHGIRYSRYSLFLSLVSNQSIPFWMLKVMHHSNTCAFSSDDLRRGSLDFDQWTSLVSETENAYPVSKLLSSSSCFPLLRSLFYSSLKFDAGWHRENPFSLWLFLVRVPFVPWILAEICWA